MISEPGRQIGAPAALNRRNRMEASDDPTLWKLWFREHGPKLLACARQWTRSRADAEDVVQDAFVRYWRHQRTLGAEAVPLLLTSIRRAAFDRARRDGRRERREHAVSAGDDGTIFAPWDVADERRGQLETALARLPVEQREVLALKIWGELTFEQIAAQLDLSPNTAASRYRYALAALRKELSAVTCHG